MDQHGHRALLEVLDIFGSQAQINKAISKTLQAVAFTTDRYDSELAEIRDEIVTVNSSLLRLCADQARRLELLETSTRFLQARVEQLQRDQTDAA